MKVGFIGLGNMGSGMAANLIRAGHEVTVFNRTPGKAQKLVEEGARHAARVADVCQGDGVITITPASPKTTLSTALSSASIGKLGQGGIHISSSTISVALSCYFAPPNMAAAFCLRQLH